MNGNNLTTETPVSERLSDIEYMYAFLGGSDVNHAYMIFRVQNVEKAGASLKAKGIRLMNQENIAQI